MNYLKSLKEKLTNQSMSKEKMQNLKGGDDKRKGPSGGGGGTGGGTNSNGDGC